MLMDENPFFDRKFNGLTPNETKLIEKVCEFEPLFDDMVFREGSRTHEMVVCKQKKKDVEDWFDSRLDLPEELEYYSHTWFVYKAEDSEDCDAYFDRENQTVCVSPEALKKDSIILHEMIHMHEFVINELPLYFHDRVYWALYKDLRNRIPKLDEIISGHAHLLTGSVLFRDGGLHDVLFLLKSFDLDIHMGYPLGTVFSYDRQEEFKKYHYLAD